MQMDKGLDTGDMLAIEKCHIDELDTGSSLHDRLASMGAGLLLQVLKDIMAGDLKAQKQDDADATYAHKLDKKEAEIDWQCDAASIIRKIQAFNSWPVAYTSFSNDKTKKQTLRLWQARLISDNGQNVSAQSAQSGEVVAESPIGIDIKAKNGLVRIIELQMPGQKRIMVKDFINGQSLSGFKF